MTERLIMTSAMQAITLVAHHCANRHTYLVHFEGSAAETTALRFIQERATTHSIVEPYEDDANVPEEQRYVDGLLYPRLYAELHPLCEHGMSLSLCYGPSHYASDEEIAQGW
jgi:hypothetical protein